MKNQIGRYSLLVASFSVLLGTAPAQAENDFEIGAFAGWHWFDDDNEIGRIDGTTNVDAPDDSLLFGIRVGYAFNWLFTLEGEIGLIPTDVDSQISSPVDMVGIVYRAHALFHFTDEDSRFRPFALAGVGGMTSQTDDQSVIEFDTDFVPHGGLGLKYRLGDNWGVRVDGRILLPPSTASEGITQDYEAMIGLYKTFRNTGPKVAGDSDGDGVADDKDDCPNKAEDNDGFRDDDGCPDVDNDEDGIPDGDDKCPDEAESQNGVDDDDGCPEGDDDGDGVLGGADKCPDAAEDKDGFEDGDGCPDPDNDGDGVADADDKCATEAETKNGYQDNDGCPDEIPAEVAKFTGKIEGIRFKSGSAVIKRSSNKVLNKAAGVLTEFKDLRMEVQGHTDSKGNADKNQALSQRRADAVRAYLVKKGVDEGRLTAKGFGDTNPIADNKTAKGRKENRRVEFKLVTE